MKKILLLFWILLFACSGSAEEIVRLTNGEWPPYSSEKLKYYGVFSRVVTDAFALEGVKVKYDFFPWKRSYKMAKDGRWDGSVTWAPTIERKRDFYFSDPVTLNTKVFFHLKSYRFDWNSINDLRGLSIGVTAQYTYGEAFDRAWKEGKIEVQEVNNDKQKIFMLLKKRLHIFPMEMDVGYYLIQSNIPPNDVQLITHHHKPIQQTPICLVISKKIEVKRSQWLLELFNRGLKRLKDTGKYEQYLLESRRGEYTLTE